MFEAFSAWGFLVQTPFGPRKSGMPESVEMPAPCSESPSEEGWGWALGQEAHRQDGDTFGG